MGLWRREGLELGEVRGEGFDCGYVPREDEGLLGWGEGVDGGGDRVEEDEEAEGFGEREGIIMDRGIVY